MKPSTDLTTKAWLAVCVVLAAGATNISSAQIPDAFTNLKVLPSDITRTELMDAMKGFTSGLGVRCVFCHVGEDGRGFQGFDFASDAKANKKTARLMWTMVQDINARQLASLEPPEGQSRIIVQCETCHRGQNRPLLTADLLLEVCLREGVDSAVARYRSLREQYYGTQTHDFSELMLLKVASSLPDSGSGDAPLRLLDLNIEMFPESAFSYFQRGMLYAAGNETEHAIADLERSLELQPGNRRAVQMLSRLKGE